jgi:hypothetical protein
MVLVAVVVMVMMAMVVMAMMVWWRWWYSWWNVTKQKMIMTSVSTKMYAVSFAIRCFTFWQICTNVSEEIFASMFREEYWGGWSRGVNAVNCFFEALVATLHGFTSQKKVV